MNRDLRDALLAFVTATVLAVAATVVSKTWSLLAANLGALFAIIFLYVPVWFGRRRGEYLIDYGFHAAPLGRGLAYAGLTALVFFPPYTFAFVWFYEHACAAGSALASFTFPGDCLRYLAASGPRFPTFDLGFGESILVQLIVVAVPEELFFRGFLHKLLEKAVPPRHRFLGGGLGWALIVSSALFALGHLIINLNPLRLAVFFPGLVFGWLYSATGSILAGTLFHAACNLLNEMLQRIYMAV